MRIDELDLLVLGHRRRDGARAFEQCVDRTERPGRCEPPQELRRTLEQRCHRGDELVLRRVIEFQLPRYVVIENDDSSSGT